MYESHKLTVLSIPPSSGLVFEIQDGLLNLGHKSILTKTKKFQKKTNEAFFHCSQSTFKFSLR